MIFLIFYHIKPIRNLIELKEHIDLICSFYHNDQKPFTFIKNLYKIYLIEKNVKNERKLVRSDPRFII